MWSIRVLELGCLVALGLACARLATPRTAGPAGLFGVSILAAAVTYLGFFDFWDSGQCEIWCTAAALISACLAMRMKSERLGAVLGGLVGRLAAASSSRPAPRWGGAGGSRRDGPRARRPGTAPPEDCPRDAAVRDRRGPAVGGRRRLLRGEARVARDDRRPRRANGYYVLHEPGVRSVADIARVVGHLHVVGSRLVAPARRALRRRHRRRGSARPRPSATGTCSRSRRASWRSSAWPRSSSSTPYHWGLGIRAAPSRPRTWRSTPRRCCGGGGFPRARPRRRSRSPRSCSARSPSPRTRTAPRTCGSTRSPPRRTC